MNEFLGKISSYNLFNYLFSGVLFVVLSNSLTSYSFLQKDIVTGVFLYYFIGLVISRLGSLIIEPILKWISFIKFTNYSDFVIASKSDTALDVLSEVNNMYRTLIAVIAGLFILKIYEILELRFIWIGASQVYILLGFLIILFLCAYRKQTNYITNRIKANLK